MVRCSGISTFSRTGRRLWNRFPWRHSLWPRTSVCRRKRWKIALRSIGEEYILRLLLRVWCISLAQLQRYPLRPTTFSITIGCSLPNRRCWVRRTFQVRRCMLRYQIVWIPVQPQGEVTHSVAGGRESQCVGRRTHGPCNTRHSSLRSLS